MMVEVKKAVLKAVANLSKTPQSMQAVLFLIFSATSRRNQLHLKSM